MIEANCLMRSPKSRNDFASAFENFSSSLIVRSMSFHMNRWLPSSKITTSIASVWYISRPYFSSSSSVTISGRRRPAMKAQDENREPAMSSSVVHAPPTTSLDSSTSTFLPSRAR
jgi:hypothetical protein